MKKTALRYRFTQYQVNLLCQQLMRETVSMGRTLDGPASIAMYLHQHIRALTDNTESDNDAGTPTPKQTGPERHGAY